jgi:hypothetical protein
MPEQYIVSGARRRARWIVLATAVAIVGGRSAVFLIWPQSYFDSDQAIVGLMAKLHRLHDQRTVRARVRRTGADPALQQDPRRHAAEAVRLSRRRCTGGAELAPGVYHCP